MNRPTTRICRSAAVAAQQNALPPTNTIPDLAAGGRPVRSTAYCAQTITVYWSS